MKKKKKKLLSNVQKVEKKYGRFEKFLEKKLGQPKHRNTYKIDLRHAGNGVGESHIQQDTVDPKLVKFGLKSVISL